MKKKALTLPILISLVVGNMIGTGIFVLPASLAKYGTISIFSWVFTSIGAMLLALTFAHLNKRFPETGGPYAYCRHAFGSLTGFIIAVIYWFGNLMSIAGIAIASIGYIGFVIPSLNSNQAAYDPLYALLFELSIIWLFTAVNIFGVHLAGVVQFCLTIAKLIPLFVVMLFGLGYMHIDYLLPLTTGDMPTFTALSSAAALTFWAFIGLEAATVPAENTSGPKDIFKATTIGTLLSSLVYIASTVVLMGMIPINELQSSQFPFAQAGTILFGNGGAKLIAIFAFVSGIGALNVCILIQGQLIFAAARDNNFPHSLAKLSKRGVPARGHIVSSLIISVLLAFTMQPNLLKQFNLIALLAAMFMLTVYLASTFAEINFVFKSKRSFLNIMKHSSTVTSILAAIYAIWMISSMDAFTIKAGVLIIICCIPLYYLVIRKYMQAMR